MMPTVSDSQSLSSASNDVSLVGNACSSILVEELGALSIVAKEGSEFRPRRIVTHKQMVALLSDDNRLMLGQLRQRDSDTSDFYLAQKSITVLSKGGIEERKYLDLAFLTSTNDLNGSSKPILVFLAEKKNKERILLAHRLMMNGSKSQLGMEESDFSSYDKVNVLGKGVSHICSAFANNKSGDVVDFFTLSNLVRKCRVEGDALKPTSARVSLPTESAESGVVAAAVHNNSSDRLVIVASRTKAASPRSKFMLEWFASRDRRDEIICAKSAIKLPEEMEPIAILADPKESRSCYLICVNRAIKISQVFKIAKGFRHEEPLINLEFAVDVAAIGLTDEGIATLLLWDSSNSSSLRLYSVQKSEGFRVKHAVCVDCPSLKTINSNAHILSCVKSQWRLDNDQIEPVLNAKCNLALVTLVKLNTNEIIREPETNLDYRVRIVGCDTQGFTSVAILLDDLDRVFEHNASDLSGALIKMCLNQPVCRDSLSLISSWLMAGRIAAVEMHFLPSESHRSLEASGSDRLVLKEMSAPRLRSILTDVDWTQAQQGTLPVPLKRQGTFTKDNNNNNNNVKENIDEIDDSSYKTTCSLSLALDEARKTDEKLRQDLERIQIMVNELQKQHRHRNNTVE